MSPNIVVYTLPGCVFCQMSISYLEKKLIEHEVRVPTPTTRKDLALTTDGNTYPKIFVGDRHIGGYDELRDLRIDEATTHRMMEISGEIDEPMCREKNLYDRFILFGSNSNEFDEIYQVYKKEVSSFWVVEEMDLSSDLLCWEKASGDEKHFIKMILSFFASLDQIVMENVSVNFGDEIKVAQVRNHFAIQNAVEAIHGEAYAVLIQTYIKEPEEQRNILKSIQTMPIITKKARWVMRWMDKGVASLAERLIAFTCVEGIQFSGAFCAIYWLKKQGRFKGLCFANSLIARDEGLHAQASVILYGHLEKKLGVDRVHEIFREAVDMEKEFIVSALPVSLIGINRDTMSGYIEYIADYWLKKLDYPMIYGTENPFEWMEMMGLEGKTNFFENRVAEYSKAGSMVDPVDQQFTLDADF